MVERHADVLAALSGQVFRLGERVGDGARTKLVNNLLAGINLVGAAEALALADSLGAGRERTLDVIERSRPDSDRIRTACLPLAGDLAPRAHMTLLAKDTRLAAGCCRCRFRRPLVPARRRYSVRPVNMACPGFRMMQPCLLF